MRFNFSSMIRRYGIPLEIQTKSGNSAGHYDELNRWVPDGDETLKVTEPLLPPGANASQSMMMSMQAGGEVGVYELYWYSEHPDMAINTIVKNVRTGKQYKVANSSDYTDYSTVTVYGLEAVE